MTSKGIIASAYAHLPCSAYLLLRISDGALARRFLSGLIGNVTTASGKREDSSLNIAFTASGLQILGLHESVLQGFSFALREGMAQDHRSRILGDVGENAPDHWLWGAPDQDRIDILLLVYEKDKVRLCDQVAWLQAVCSSSGVHAVELLQAGPTKNREHFGFVDGISQPLIDGDGPFEDVYQKALGRSGLTARVKAGEFILGYIDESGHVAPSSTLMVGGTTTNNPAAAELSRNGSYLVFRHLKQYVGRFRTFMAQSTLGPDGQPNPLAAEVLAAKMVGRWTEGAPLVRADIQARKCPSRANEFSYAEEDPDGLKCPVGAHIRRANPRDSLDLADPAGAFDRVQRRRLLRRGRSFGPCLPPGEEEDHVDRGLYFICLCADLERQFEFVQQTWMNNPEFATLSAEGDPLMGPVSAGRRFTIPKTKIPSQVSHLQQFVALRGGAYFFLPGIRALRILTQGNSSHLGHLG